MAKQDLINRRSEGSALDWAIECHSICKKYGDVDALSDISLSVDKGELFGIIGPDGAGKTTLIRVLNTLLLADSGEAKVCGFDVVSDYKIIRHLIGYMPGTFSLYQDLTVEENLNFYATIFGTTISENYYLIKDIYSQIEPFKKRRAGALSGGMKQKLALSCALIHKPNVLFLDEPTTGVDPVSRKELWQMLLKLKEQGITIFVSTSYMDEATLCDRIALMQRGKFIAVDTPQQIISNYKPTLWAVRADGMYSLLKELRELSVIKSCFSFGDKHHVTVQENFSTEKLYNYLIDRGYLNVEIEPIKPTIEDCYMELSTNISE